MSYGQSTISDLPQQAPVSYTLDIPFGPDAPQKQEPFVTYGSTGTPFGPEQGALDALREVVGERRDAALAHTPGDAGRRLRARLGRIDAALRALATLGPVPMQRVHGDLHAGQFLRGHDRERLVLTDFDGDPMTASADRLVVQPAERDLAGLVQSIDHVGRVAAKRRPGADVDAFIGPAVDAALIAYAEVRPYDDVLLWALRVAQELHEYAYAALHLPVWGYVPDAAMCHLFPEEDPA